MSLPTMNSRRNAANLASTVALAGVVGFAMLEPTAANDFSGRVVGVSDGDTITVLHDNVPTKVRLAGIDAPEKRQTYGARAKQYTSEAAYGRNVNVHYRGLDRYGRVVGEVVLPDGSSLNRKLVRDGMAWQYRKYSRDTSLTALEYEARGAARGLWSAGDPVAPWDYRKACRRRSALGNLLTRR